MAKRHIPVRRVLMTGVALVTLALVTVGLPVNVHVYIVVRAVAVSIGYVQGNP